MSIETMTVVRALSGGAATLDALAARTGAGRDELLWALEEAAGRGWIAAPRADGDGLCGGSAPPVYRLTGAGRRALAAGRAA